MKKLELTIGQAINQFDLDKQAQYGKEGMYEFEINMFLRLCGLNRDNLMNVLDDKYILLFQKELLSRNLRMISINHYLRCVRVFLYWCMDKGYIKPFKIHTIKAQLDQIKFYSDEEVDKLLKVGRNTFTDDRSYVIVAFILSTGARAGTIIEIHKDDIDLVKGEVYYRHLKNKNTAIIPLPKSLILIIKNYLYKWDIRSEYLFPDVSNNQLTVSGLRQGIDRLCKKAGVQKRGIHSLRHSFARMFIKNGGDAFVLQQYLTHSNISTTQNYVHLFSDDLRASMNNYIPLDKLLPGDTKRIIRRSF